MAEMVRPNSSTIRKPVSAASVIAGRTCSAALASRTSYAGWARKFGMGQKSGATTRFPERGLPHLVTGFVTSHPHRAGIGHIEPVCHRTTATKSGYRRAPMERVAAAT